MIRTKLHKALLLVALSSSLFGQSLKIATLNLWTGLDYHGVFRIGEYESAETREKRFQMVVREFQSSHPDVIALQEANPVGSLTSRLATALDYDYVCQRVDSGLKLGPLGMPWNLNEGLAILARKDLGVEFVDVNELASVPGAIGNWFSLHAHENNIALVAKIRFHNVSILVLNVHTAAAVPFDSSSTTTLRKILESDGIDERDWPQYTLGHFERARSLEHQLDLLANDLSERFPGVPKIMLGDLNVAPSSTLMQRFLRKTKLVDVNEQSDQRINYTWDPERNSNIRFSRDSLDASKERLGSLDLLSAWYDGVSRKIDYILVDSILAVPSPSSAKVFLDSPDQGLYASDHYGVIADISLTELLARSPANSDSVQALQDSELEPLPILSYDTDVGLGYGAKVFYLNPLGRNESFDLVLFNSTKGERWYRFVFSVPDFEVRQGKIYPLALDFIADYDKYLKNSFFGVGNGSRFENREYYTREPLELSLVLSRGISTREVAQAGVKFKLVTNVPLSDSSRLITVTPSLNTATARYHSLFMTYRFDSRNSFINPSHGLVLLGEAEYAPRSALTNVSLARIGAWSQYYATLFYPKTVLAIRLGMQGLIGNNLPVQVMLPIGGNQTVRGSPQDRYLDKISAILNAEIRFPVYWRFGGVLGYDAGKVWHNPTDFDLVRWASNPVIGLRFFMDTYVVRMDLGFGKETTGFYLNFGHLF